MINITLWLIAWVPFAVTTLIGIIGDQEILTPLVSGIPTFMAKSSCIYNPIIYAISHPKYKQVVFME
jgi:r-opsin